MRVEAIAVRIVRLRRVLGAAQRRHARRHNRSSAIWYGYKDYYKKQPRVSSQYTLYEEWDGSKRRWFYEDAYCLELEAAILMNWITVLLNEAIRLRGPAYERSPLLTETRLKERDKCATLS